MPQNNELSGYVPRLVICLEKLGPGAGFLASLNLFEATEKVNRAECGLTGHSMQPVI